MANLLLEKDKKKIFKELILRFFIVFLLFFLSTICIAIVILIPSYVLTLTNETSISDEIQIFKKTIDFRKQDLPIEILNKENLKINFLRQSRDFYISNFISEVIKDKPKDIKINGFFYEKEKDGEKEEVLVIRGKSKNRNILISFIENLEKKNLFAKIDFPVSNLIKGESIDFSVKIYLKEI